MAWQRAVACVGLLACLLVAYCDGQAYEDKYGLYKDIDVYLVPHSHCDVGWKLTVDQYYDQQVAHILQGVSECLEYDNPNPDPRLQRKFNWDVQAFFQMFWSRADEAQRDIVRQQVADGRFTFIGFGWVQSDEAAADLYGRVMQLTEGHQAIARLFPEVIDAPRVAWQIDPFGFSSISPTLFAKAGFDAMVNCRIPRAQQNQFRVEHGLDFVWNGNPLGSSYPLLVHNMGDGQRPYATPGDPPPRGGGRDGFRWEDGLSNNPLITPSNVAARSEVFANDLQVRSAWFKPGAPLLVPFGADFLFQDAALEFDNMDPILEYINDHSDTFHINIKYATVQEWVVAMQESELEWPTYQGDFLPYNKVRGNIWGGYFTTRPHLKRTIRQALAAVRSAEQLHALMGVQALSSVTSDSYMTSGYQIDEARQEVSICHHHDAITGTSYHPVVADYLERLDKALTYSADAAGISASALMCKFAKEDGLGTPACPLLQGYILEGNQTVIFNPSQLATNQSYAMVYHNSLTQNRQELVSVKSRAPLKVVDADGTEQQTSTTTCVGLRGCYIVTFVAKAPALGLTAYYITESSEATGVCDLSTPSPGMDATMSNEVMTVVVSGQTGGIKSVTFADGEPIPLGHAFYQYYSPSSDAYQFHPTSETPVVEEGGVVLLTLCSCDLYETVVAEVRQGLTMTYRLAKVTPQDTYGIEALAIDIHASIDAMRPYNELVQRFDTEWATNNYWYTDNGHVLDQHQLFPYYDFTESPQVSSNYKAMKSSAMLVNSTESIGDVDGAVTNGLLLLAGQSAGTTSMVDGQLEVMMHRCVGSSTWQDHLGAELKYRLALGPLSLLQYERPLQNLEVQFPLVPLYATVDGMPYDDYLAFGSYNTTLEDSVHLFSMAAFDFYGLAIPGTDAYSAAASGVMDNIDPAEIAIRFSNLYSDQVGHADLPLSNCQAKSCEERGLTLLPLRERLQFQTDAGHQLKPFAKNQEYNLTELMDFSAHNETCSMHYLSPNDIRSFIYNFQCY